MRYLSNESEDRWLEFERPSQTAAEKDRPFERGSERPHCPTSGRDVPESYESWFSAFIFATVAS